jgi:hypothetical protein
MPLSGSAGRRREPFAGQKGVEVLVVPDTTIVNMARLSAQCSLHFTNADRQQMVMACPLALVMTASNRPASC